MSNAMLNIYVRVIKKRMVNGEDLDVILSEYTKLTSSEISQILDKINSQLSNFVERFFLNQCIYRRTMNLSSNVTSSSGKGGITIGVVYRPVPFKRNIYSGYLIDIYKHVFYNCLIWQTKGVFQ